MSESTASKPAIPAPRRGLLTHWGLVHVYPVAIVFLLETLVTKSLQIIEVNGSFGLGALLQAWTTDLSVAIGMVAIAGVAFSWLRRWAKLPVAIIFYAVVTFMLLLTAFTHAYFLKTGTNLSWSTVQYALINAVGSTKIVASETQVWSLAFLLGQLVIALAAIIVPRLRAIKRKTGPQVVPAKRAAITLAVAAVLTVGLALVPPLEGPAMVVSRTPSMDVMTGALVDVFVDEDEVVLSAEERLDPELELVKEPGAPTPNVVVLIFESLNWKNSDVYTPGLGTTPFLAELAKKSWVVENQYTVVPHTTKAIMPLLCGIYPYPDTPPKEATPGILPRRCLAHVLGSQGYATAFFQPAANFEKRNLLVNNMGFQTYKGLDDMPQEGFESISYFGREDLMMVEPSMDWVDSVSGKKPFFLTYLTLATHHNYVTPQSFPYTDFPVDDPDYKNYMNAVKYIDHFMEKVFDEFEKRGLIDNTVFIIVGDHGEGFGEHKRRQHDMVIWEEGLHSFAMLYAPSLVPGSGTIEGFRSHIDVLPTVADILGLTPTKGSFLGTSWLEPVPDDRVIYNSCWFKNQCLAIREGPIKYIYHYDLLPMEVYDTSKDPFDEQNLALTGPYTADVLEGKQEAMKHWVKVVKKQYQEWEDHLFEGKVSATKPAVATPLEATFDDTIRLVGYTLDTKEVMAGQDVTITYVFEVLDKPDPHDKLFVHVLHDKSPFANADHVPVKGTYPVKEWQPGQFIVDEHTFHVPGSWDSGKAKVALGFWNTKTKKRLPVTSSAAEIDEQRLVVANFGVQGVAKKSAMTITKRRDKIKSWIGFDEPAYGTPIHAVFGDAVELVGMTGVRMEAPLAGTVEMTYVFKGLGKVPSSWKLSVKLVRDDGRTIDGDHVPINGMYHPKYWRKGEYVVDKHKIHIDMKKNRPGTYKVWLGFTSKGKPVGTSSELPQDSLGRVDIGTVVIKPKAAVQ